ncbi:MAG TPA: HdeD family acid-resistance protein [Gemmataceae bacterium]|nr:HdeD family acid-resistance protein [Gemmataceae bacterium]
MSTISAPSDSSGSHELHSLRNQWWCFLLLGIALIVLGTFCIVDPLIPTLASVIFLGFLLMAAGITQIVSAFWAGKWSGMLIHMLIGVLYIVVGYMIVDSPVVNMVLITKFIAIFLIVSGAFRIVSALVVRFRDWGWALLNGGVTLLLGIIINRQLPEAALWVIGLFIGIEMIFNGWAWVMLALGLRAVAKRS